MLKIDYDSPQDIDQMFTITA